MTTFQDVGLSLQVHASLPSGGAWIYSLGVEVMDYSHTISANGGFESASFRLVGATVDIEDWLERGVGRHVQVWDSDLALVWEGYVDQVSVTQGSLAYAVGPMSDLGNRVLAVYDALNTAYIPPTEEGRAVTTLANDADSQGRYGIWEKSVSAGKTTALDAGYVRDTFLSERKYPARTQSVSTGGGEASSVSISLRGYYAWLSAYTYSQTAASGTTSATALIQAVLAADTNAIISTDYGLLDANALLVPAYATDNVFADSKISEVVALGDAAGGRWTFGLYANRIAVYRAIPTTLAYSQSMQSSDQEVYLYGGGKVRPWQVRPAQWIFMDDFLVGKPLGVTLATDLRCAFIEQVSFTAPYQVSWSGGRLSQLDQIMAQMTMGGMQ